MADFETSNKAEIKSCKKLTDETAEKQWISEGSVDGVRYRAGCQHQYDWDLKAGVEATCLSLPQPKQQQYIDKQHQVNESLSDCMAQIPPHLKEGTYTDGFRYVAEVQTEPYLTNAEKATEQTNACVKKWTDQTRANLSQEQREIHATSSEEKMDRGGCKGD